MEDNTDKNFIFSKTNFRSMFFVIKSLALFFFSVPLIQYISEAISGKSVIDNAGITISMIMTFLLVSCMIFLWLLLDKNHNRNKYVPYIEAAIFFLYCSSSVYFSGGIYSYHKFIYLFVVVLYTIELGIKTGLILSACASGLLLVLDLIFYDGSSPNICFENDIVLSAVFFIIAWTLGSYVKVEKEVIETLKKDVNLDGLTQIYNHRYFYDTIQKLCENGKNISLLMIDIDYFKSYNDMYGHQKGDESLKQLTHVIQANIPGDAVFCRYGGEEFSVILINSDVENAKLWAEIIRKSVAEADFYGQDHMPDNNFTVSVGASAFYGNDDTYLDLIHRADDALYRAKYMRRNSIEIYSSIFAELETTSDIQDKIKYLKTLISIIHSRDSYTYSHVEKVVYLCEVFADYLKLDPQSKQRLLYAAYLHDLGKINVSKEILISSRKLTDDEWNELKTHPEGSAHIIEGLDGFKDIVPIVLEHHERFDGTGYPSHLKGNEINYLARVLSIADSFDAMTSNRPYQRSKTIEEAFQEIRNGAGTQFDPTLTEPFLAAVNGMKISQ